MPSRKGQEKSRQWERYGDFRLEGLPKLSSHARQRMKERNVSYSDVLKNKKSAGIVANEATGQIITVIPDSFVHHERYLYEQRRDARQGNQVARSRTKKKKKKTPKMTITFAEYQQQTAALGPPCRDARQGNQVAPSTAKKKTPPQPPQGRQDNAVLAPPSFTQNLTKSPTTPSAAPKKETPTYTKSFQYKKATYAEWNRDAKMVEKIELRRQVVIKIQKQNEANISGDTQKSVDAAWVDVQRMMQYGEQQFPVSIVSSCPDWNDALEVLEKRHDLIIVATKKKKKIAVKIIGAKKMRAAAFQHLKDMLQPPKADSTSSNGNGKSTTTSTPCCAPMMKATPHGNSKYVIGLSCSCFPRSGMQWRSPESIKGIVLGVLACGMAVIEFSPLTDSHPAFLAIQSSEQHPVDGMVQQLNQTWKHVRNTSVLTGLKSEETIEMVLAKRIEAHLKASPMAVKVTHVARKRRTELLIPVLLWDDGNRDKHMWNPVVNAIQNLCLQVIQVEDESILVESHHPHQLAAIEDIFRGACQKALFDKCFSDDVEIKVAIIRSIATQMENPLEI